MLSLQTGLASKPRACDLVVGRRAAHSEQAYGLRYLLRYRRHVQAAFVIECHSDGDHPYVPHGVMLRCQEGMRCKALSMLPCLPARTLRVSLALRLAQQICGWVSQL